MQSIETAAAGLEKTHALETLLFRDKSNPSWIVSIDLIINHFVEDYSDAVFGYPGELHGTDGVVADTDYIDYLPLLHRDYVDFMNQIHKDLFCNIQLEIITSCIESINESTAKYEKIVKNLDAIDDLFKQSIMKALAPLYKKMFEQLYIILERYQFQENVKFALPRKTFYRLR